MTTAKFTDSLPEPIAVLESFLERAGTTIVQAAFRYSFFIDPERVRQRTPYFGDRARKSREHYPKGDRGDMRQWKGVDVRLGDNGRAQMAWEKYTGRPIARGSGYGVRHIWGNPWDPFAFTAGWNLCYMPFWLGMITEKQHPHDQLQRAIQQASYDLYFRDEPVCQRPDYVIDPALDLRELLGEQPILILDNEEARTGTDRLTHRRDEVVMPLNAQDRILAIRKAANASWSNIVKGIAALDARSHEPFGTVNVANSSKSVVRRMLKETGLSLPQLEAAVAELASRHE